MRHTWWAISAESFLAALKRAHAGEDPDLLYIEYVANSSTERVDRASGAATDHAISDAGDDRVARVAKALRGTWGDWASRADTERFAKIAIAAIDGGDVR